MAQLAISLAGAAIGNFIAPGIGGPVGFALGSALGGALFAPDLPRIYGPKITDGTVTTSTYGAAIPMVWGTISVPGNIIDVGPLITVSHTSTSGGKGGPEQKTTTFTQYMDYDVAIAASVDEIVQIYANEKLIYDGSATATVAQPAWLNWTLYKGTETQDADPTFESNRGAGNVPGYRGTAHIVFKRFKVTEFGTTLINFRFVVTSNGSTSVTSWTYTQESSASAAAMSIRHNAYVDLMIGSVFRVQNSATPKQMLVAIDPYNHTEVWSAYIQDTVNYGKAYWVDFFSFPVVDSLGIPLYQRNQFISVYHYGEESIAPRARYLRIFDARNGAQFGIVQLQNSSSTPKLMSCYDDDAVFFDTIVPSSPGASTLYRVRVDSLLNKTSVLVTEPTGYQLTTKLDNIYCKRGSLLADSAALILLTVENSSTGRYGFTVFTDIEPGAGATSYTPNYSSVAELTASDGAPFSAVYDSANDCFWALNAGSAGTVTRISKVTTAGVISSTTDWSSTFTISGAPSGSAHALALDNATGHLVVIIGGVAYRWPTWDITQTPTSAGSSIAGNPIEWHDYTGTLFTGDTTSPEFTQYRLRSVAGNGVTLQSVVEDIFDEAGTNLTTADRSATALSAITVDGFRVAKVMPRRSALLELATAYLFDFVPRSGVMTAILRGGSSSATLDDDTLGAHIEGSESPPRLTISRAAESSLPQLVGVSFIDSTQNYDVGYEHASRQASAGGTESKIELAVVLSHDDAAQLASVLLHAAHIEAETYQGQSMPSTRGTVIPAGIVTATVGASSYPMRITRGSIVDGGIIAFDGVRHDASIYTDYTAGGATRDRAVTVFSIGPTTLVVLDLPALRDADLDTGIYLASHSYSPTWQGAEYFDSSDGVNYSAVGTTASEATVGYLTTALADSTDPVDMANTISVRLVSGSLASITHDVMQTTKTANVAAVGSAGRWEIIRFQTASQGTDGIWSLTVLHRHLFDTFPGAAAHAVGDTFVLLEQSTMWRLAVSSADLNSLRYIKAVTIGQPIDQVQAVTTTPTAAGMKCFAPGCLHASLSGGVWSLSWQRQDRRQAGFMQQPVNSEDSEAYSVQILDFGDNVVATYSASAESYSYTAAQQTTDFGGAVTYLKWQVAQVSALLGAGRYQSHSSGTFSADYDALVTARGTLIEYWPQNETTGSTMISDSGSHNGVYFITTTNQPAICYDGQPTVKTTGTGRYDVSGWAGAGGTGDVKCAEVWIKPDALPSAIAVIVCHPDGGGTGWYLYANSNGTVGLYLESSSSQVGSITTTTAMVADQVYHIVASFGHTSGDDMEIWINGVLAASGTTTGNFSPPTTAALSSGSIYWSTATANMDRWHNKFALYDTPLTQLQIYQDAIAGFGP